MPIRMASLRDTITIYNRVLDSEGATSRYGDPLDEEEVGVDVPAAVAPVGAAGGLGSSIELEQNRDTRISRYVVTVAPEVDLDALARVEWNDRSFEVIGEPRLLTDRQGPHHYDFTMEERLG